jgi:hypothetical protein
MIKNGKYIFKNGLSKMDPTIIVAIVFGTIGALTILLGLIVEIRMRFGEK